MHPSFAELIALVPSLYLIAVAVPLAVIDVRQRRLPNRLVLPGIGLALLAQLVASAVASVWPILALGVAFVLATVLVLFAFTLRKNRLGSTIPLGPYLLLGFGVSLTALVLS